MNARALLDHRSYRRRHSPPPSLLTRFFCSLRIEVLLSRRQRNLCVSLSNQQTSSLGGCLSPPAKSPLALPTRTNFSPGGWVVRCWSINQSLPPLLPLSCWWVIQNHPPPWRCLFFFRSPLLGIVMLFVGR